MRKDAEPFKTSVNKSVSCSPSRQFGKDANNLMAWLKDRERKEREKKKEEECSGERRGR